MKPANILVSRQGIKLLDFGLAMQRPDSSVVVVPDQERTGAMTGAHTILGTVPYMSPEQAQGKAVDSRSDIFSFGLVLYEMITGARAFDGPDPTSVMAAIIERPAPSVGGLAPSSFDRVLQKCLAKDPDDRWQSARDLRTALDWSGETAPPPPPSRALCARSDNRASVHLPALIVTIVSSAIEARGRRLLKLSGSRRYVASYDDQRPGAGGPLGGG